MIALKRAGVLLGGRTAAAEVTLRVASGGWTMLIGPNGAGKTTVLRAVGGLVAYRGSITVAGREARAMRVRERARTIAFVQQSPLMPASMSVFEYVLLGRTAHLGPFGRESAADHAAVAAAVARLDLGRLVERPLGRLSGGERQRAAIARAVAQDAPVLLLDEPTTALDIGRQQEALELVAELRAERALTVLGAMHDLTLAGQYADRLALLDRGHLVGAGAPDEVLTEELVARHYRARVRIAPGERGPVVIPTRPAIVAPGGESEARKGEIRGERARA